MDGIQPVGGPVWSCEGDGLYPRVDVAPAPPGCFIDFAKAFDCVDHNKLWKILKEMDDQTP